MTDPSAMNPQPGDKWTFDGRRFVVDRTQNANVGLCVFLTCLDPPHDPQPGYVGGGSREARITTAWLRSADWTPGHGEQLAEAA
jgi:hypothetical protein